MNKEQGFIWAKKAAMEAKKECATCKHWQPGKTSEAMQKLKLANCRFQPKWSFLPPQGSCGRYMAATPKAVAARLVWLEPANASR